MPCREDSWNVGPLLQNTGLLVSKLWIPHINTTVNIFALMQKLKNSEKASGELGRHDDLADIVLNILKGFYFAHMTFNIDP